MKKKQDTKSFRKHKEGGSGDIGLFITLVPKFFKYRFLIRWIKQPWGLLLNFDWFVHLVECPNVSTTNFNLHKR